MPISSQYLQKKAIGDFYNKTHKNSHGLLMKNELKYKHRLDHCNDNLSILKEGGVVMNLISATNNHCFDFKKKTGVDTTKKILVNLVIFLLSIKQADSASLNSNPSTEVSTITFPSSNQTSLDGFGVIDFRNKNTDEHQNKKINIGGDSEINPMGINKKVKKHKVKRGCEPDKVYIWLNYITRRIEADPFALERSVVMDRIVREINQAPNMFEMLGIEHLRNHPNPIRLVDLPQDLIDNIGRQADILIDNIFLQRENAARRREMEQPEHPVEAVAAGAEAEAAGAEAVAAGAEAEAAGAEAVGAEAEAAGAEAVAAGAEAVAAGVEAVAAGVEAVAAGVGAVATGVEAAGAAMLR